MHNLCICFLVRFNIRSVPIFRSLVYDQSCQTSKQTPQIYDRKRTMYLDKPLPVDEWYSERWTKWYWNCFERLWNHCKQTGHCSWPHLDRSPRWWPSRVPASDDERIRWQRVGIYRDVMPVLASSSWHRDHSTQHQLRYLRTRLMQWQYCFPFRHSSMQNGGTGPEVEMVVIEINKKKKHRVKYKFSTSNLHTT